MGPERRGEASPAERAVWAEGLAFRVHSSGPDGPRAPFVLVHGIGMSHRYLARLQTQLARRGERVHSVDLPGFGGLPRPARDVGIVAMAEALGAGMAALGIGSAVLVGQSMGTQWVTELAARRPDLADAVALIGPVADERHRTIARQSAALAVDVLREPPGANALVFTDYLRCGPAWYLAQLRHMLSYPLQERIGAVRAPMLLLRGSRDPIAGQEWARRLADAARSGTLAVVPGHAHNVQHAAPRAVASALTAFTAATHREAR